MMGIYVGTSGWHYKHWVGAFYPINLKPEDFLEFYARRFATVELNNSFYHLPLVSSIKTWKKIVPANFRFAVKASRLITHNKKLKDAEEAFATFHERIKILGNKLGPTLFQLPPKWNFNAERLDKFLDALPRAHTYAMEFRNQSWICDEAFALLCKHHTAFCISDWPGLKMPLEVIGKRAYVRFHGAGGRYQGSYSRADLKKWARRMSDWNASGKDVYAYFNNDAGAMAPRNAATLMCLLNPSDGLITTGSEGD